MTKAVVSLSGGMDSATVLYEAIAKHGPKEVEAITFKYGSKHGEHEIQAADAIAVVAGVPWELRDISSVFYDLNSNLLKTGGAIPEGHYESKSMSQTVVPGRNMIFTTILAGIAWSREAPEVWIGPHQGDHAIYEDCRPAYVYSMNAAIVNGTGDRVRLVAPFLYGNKTSIIARGSFLGVPYRLTRTCYQDQTIACGKCGSCQERLAAFDENNLQDPIDYETREILPKV